MKPLTKRDLDTPSLCLDLDLLEGNIARLAAFLEGTGVRVRPHTKTHKSPTIAWMQLSAGAIGVTCAKVGEAEVMAQAGIRDILIANQVVGAPRIRRLMGLAAYSDVMVALDDAANARDLSAAAEAYGLRLRVLLEVNVGMNRCGVEPGAASLALARVVTELPGLRFEGIMGYEGHCVMLPDYAERTRATETAMASLVGTGDLLEAEGIPVGIVSAGGTGTHAITGAYAGVTELQAGSYATMDAKYRSVGVDYAPALTLVARVINAQPDRAVIDAGMKALTHEFGMAEVVSPVGWRLDRLSEEHGALVREGGAPLQAGDLVEMVPSHGCTTINLHDTYQVTRGEQLLTTWPISARGKVR